jgi:hypothetical protein
VAVLVTLGGVYAGIEATLATLGLICDLLS